MQAIGSAVMKVIGPVVMDQLMLAWGVDEDIRTLEGLMNTINAVLLYAQPRAIDDEVQRIWRRDLKEVASDAEDVLDELQIDAALREGKKDTVLCYLCSIFSSLYYRNKTARNIKDIVRRFNEITERKKFHPDGVAPVVSQLHPVVFSCPPVDEIFGREDDNDVVVERLTQVGNGGRDVSVLTIVGLAGVGKTTLARMVYNDPRILKHFEVRILVSVGKHTDFDLKAIAQAMLQRVSGERIVPTLEGMSPDDMRILIGEKFMNKRYLLILDDVWNEDKAFWDNLMCLLSGSSHGSKIVVTTRSPLIETIVDATHSAHKLKVLSDADCGMIFKQRAFGPGRATESPQMVEIGEEIVRRCGGLPLAAKSLGSLMATKREEAEWLAIKNNEIWNLEKDPDGILLSLQLSYDQLSPQLKRCFAYCVVFPKDYKIQKLRLIQLWIAQGFIQPNSGMNLEDIGAQYFNTLLNMSFFQDEEKDDLGNIMSCKMHYLVHDLAYFVAKDESSIKKVDEKIILLQGCRYSSIIFHETPSSSIEEIGSVANNLRSFFLLQGCRNIRNNYTEIDDDKFSKEISNLTRLRALYLDCISKDNIVNILQELKHLRFLELSDLRVEALPDSITNLRKLQTLNLGYCTELKGLPKSMMTMINLRHLDIKGCYDLNGMPCGIGNLTNLQTLSWFYVGMEESHARIAELQHLNQIKGKLIIHGLSNVEDPKDAKDAKLRSKSGLLSLELNWGKSRKASALFIDVLENLEPHPYLKRLCIVNYGGKRFPSWFTNPTSPLLPNLVYLRLDSLPNCESLPPLGLLPYLKELELDDMHVLKKVGKELYGESTSESAVSSFPSLQRMSLELAYKLEEWSVPERGAFLNLEYLRIRMCPNLTILGSIPSLCMSNLESVRGMELDQQNHPPPSFKSLSRLTIADCRSLAALPEWLRGIVSLQSLTIKNCPNLQMLPDGIQHLNELTIAGCPHLKRRCERETGDDWLKISRIPDVHIG